MSWYSRLTPEEKQAEIRRVKAYQKQHPDRAKETRRRVSRRSKLEAILGYGAICTCCGEDRIEFLSIDHIDGGGVQHRREVGTGNSFYLWLRKQQYPPGFRVLCMNCNSALGHYGRCPHQAAIQELYLDPADAFMELRRPVSAA